MEQTTAERVRKTLTGACMIAAPIAFLVGDLTWPVKHSKAASALADAMRVSDSRIWFSTLVTLAGMALFVGAVLGLAHMLHEHHPALAITGGAVALVGLVFVAAIIGAQGVFLTAAVRHGSDAATVAMVKDVVSLSMPLGLMTMLVGIGAIVLAVGLMQAKLIPMWAGVLIIIAAVGLDIGPATALKPVIYAAEIALIVGLGAVGVEVLTETDEQWEHTPVFHGFTRATA